MTIKLALINFLCFFFVLYCFESQRLFGHCSLIVAGYFFCFFCCRRTEYQKVTYKKEKKHKWIPKRSENVEKPWSTILQTIRTTSEISNYNNNTVYRYYK